MLWEDFNEELYSTKGSATSSSREVVELRYALALTVTKTNNTSLLPTKNNKPGMVVIVKLMKKLLSINNSQGSKDTLWVFACRLASLRDILKIENLGKAGIRPPQIFGSLANISSGYDKIA
ncbi:hypothetical protein JHK86_004691 [Glycine max]|nr:hypothetical protein JHK86_004691 [Glycine max]